MPFSSASLRQRPGPNGFFATSSWGRRFRGRFAGCCRSSCRRTSFDTGNYLVAENRIALFLQYFLKHAILRCNHFQHHFVGFDIHQQVVAGYRFAGLFVPGGDFAVLNRFGECRGLDFD